MKKDNSFIESQLEGSFWSLTFREFLSSSAHFPVANLIFESLNENPAEYFLEADPYILLFVAIAQSLFLTYLRKRNVRFKFWGNFVGPILYTMLELPSEGMEFFREPQHQAYYLFSLSIGLIQLFKNETNHPEKMNFFEVIENIVRTLIPLFMYMLFEASEKNFFSTIPHFFSDPPHIFLAIVLFLLGILIGTSEAQNSLSKIKLKNLARKLKEYSSWSLGKQILNSAVSDEGVFEIKRVHRSIIFLDIRGFTKWSEKETPENVVNMLNNYYLKSEEILVKFKILKTKYTADEIMLVLENIDHAAAAALTLRDTLNSELQKYNLKVGGGLHYGIVVEGLIGSLDHKLYDVMGDTVNTAKRLCESAKGEEILISKDFIDITEGRAFTTESRDVILKGKEGTFTVYPLVQYL